VFGDRVRHVRAEVVQRLLRAGHLVRFAPHRAALRIVTFTVRWALRLALPLAGAAAMLHLFPYRTTAGGVHFRIEGTLVTRSGFSANTTLGNWEFPHVDGLPIGVHISPENVDLVELATRASAGRQSYVDGLRSDIGDQLPWIVTWLVGELVLGFLAGLGIAMAVSLAGRYLRNLPRRREWRIRLLQLGAAFAVLGLVAGYGALTYNPHWVRESRITGTLGAAQLFPDRLSQYYTKQTKAFDVINAIAGIQAQLQQHVEQSNLEPEAFQIMFISDMHLASTYPLVRQYATNFHVSLIVDTGDESEFGTREEMTPSYVAQIRQLTRTVPMIWLAGNHDSPATVAVMRSIPGVVVLGDKRARNGGYQVSGQQIDMYGLTIGAVPDPRVYGAGGDFGSNVPDVVRSLQERTMDSAVRSVPGSARFDIMATHEPLSADRLVRDLPGQIRQTNAGHLHAQNSQNQIDKPGRITLVEGSTGAGGLDNINRDVPPPPVEFTIESVAASCQFTKVVRFQLVGPLPRAAAVPDLGLQVSATTRYLKPQHVAEGRSCGTGLPRGAVQPLGGTG